MDQRNEELLDAITAALPPLLTALKALDYAARHLHPPNIPELAATVAPMAQPLRDGLAQFEAVDFPEHLGPFKAQVLRAGECAGRALDGLGEAAAGADGPMGAYRALGQRTRAVEALYPIAATLPPLNRFFVEAKFQEDDALLAKLAAADASRSEVGIIHADNAKGERGDFSLYVPEYYAAERDYPLIVALHGGSGHGRDFLWTWLVEARSRGAILLSPTAKDRTWSLMGPDIDTANIHAMVDHVAGRWRIDRRRVLLTGMSDGGTFCYVSGLRSDSLFTHLAPSSASFHPLLLNSVSRERLRGLPIFLMHGVLDWMFPVDIARSANEALTAAGASVCYREIEDLSHTWPRDENPRIMDWFLESGTPSP